MEPDRSGSDNELWKYFPALKPIGAILIFTLRLSGTIFGLAFAGGSAFIAFRWIIPTARDLSRTPNERMLAALFGLIPLAFFVIGIFIIRDALTRKDLEKFKPKFEPRSREEMLAAARRSGKTTVVGMQTLADGSVLVSSASVYRFLAIFLAFFGTIWNGVILLAISDKSLALNWILALKILFLMPFISVGMGMVYVFLKVLGSLNQPIVEIRLPKADFEKGEEVIAEIRLRDPKRKAKNLRAVLRKRRFGVDESLDENVLAEKDGSELDFEWSQNVSFRLDAEADDGSEWALEVKVESDQPLPLYLAAPLRFSARSTTA